MSEEKTKPSLTLYFLNAEDRDSFLEQINSIKFESGDYYEVKDAPFIMHEKDVGQKRDIAINALEEIIENTNGGHWFAEQAIKWIESISHEGESNNLK